jgi:hypothetical protein
MAQQANQCTTPGCPSSMRSQLQLHMAANWWVPPAEQAAIAEAAATTAAVYRLGQRLSTLHTQA